MLINACTLPINQCIETDICIVGAGAAGITLAREFIGQSFRVCLLESGGLKFNRVTQSLYKGENIGHLYRPLDVVRSRYFGGTTNRWSGRCEPFEAIDFEDRPWIPYSGWPFDKSHLELYYERPQSVCQIGPFGDIAKRLEALDTPLPSVLSERLVRMITQYSPPTRFGTLYRDELRRASNIVTYLHANVAEIETTASGQSVTRLRVVTLPGNQFWIAAKVFILAAGGIENPRMLLLSNKIQRNGLGNQHDLVGRFFMTHPRLMAGVFFPVDTHNMARLHWHYRRVNGVQVRADWSLSEETMRHEKLLNFRAFFAPSYPGFISNGVASFYYLLHEGRHGYLPNHFMKNLRNILTDIPNVAIHGFKRMLQPYLKVKNFKEFRIENTIEQAPNPDSRVTLSTRRDTLGLHRVQLQWRLSDIDKCSLIRAQRILREELRRAGLGQVRNIVHDDDTAWRYRLEGVAHHIGTTRMHVNPKKGVVDENCKVHGISNLFIAGSSIFPTSGAARPTLTIVALALRLADHVKISLQHNSY